jgi:APA family basic amino acid/polyamine antiporter
VAEQHSEGLIRAIGVRQLAASIVNSTIGAGIFVVPALVAQGLGAAAPIAYVLCAVTMALLVTTFAMAGSRVTKTGGLFAYVEAAFGSYVGFLAGTLQWLSGLLAAGGVAIAFLDASAVVVPALHAPIARLATLALLLATFAVLNTRGVKTGARTIELMTIAKLLPLLSFVVVGAFFVQPSSLAWTGTPPAGAVGRAVLLLSFAFVGIELALTPSGEVQAPARSVPRAVYLALVITATLYIAIHVVAQGVLGAALAENTDAPLAEAARRFLGRGGATLMLAGTLVSMLGYMSGDALCSPRNLYAFGRDGFIPAAFGNVHAVSRTPRLAIWTHAVLVFAVANSGTFESVAILSNVATFTLYLMACLASLRLVRRGVRGDGEPFAVPGSAVIATLAIGAVLLIMSSATVKEFGATGVTLAIASLVYRWRRHPEPASPAGVS